jgi:hypothetical protein
MTKDAAAAQPDPLPGDMLVLLGSRLIHYTRLLSINQEP